jgi:acetyltransferase-like isoleucine patch superfamily enzyme
MRLSERLYRSPLGRPMSAVARWLAALHTPRMIYGYLDPRTGDFRKYTRISSTATVMSPHRLFIGEDVWVWHHSIIDATEGIEIADGVQIGAWVGIFSHGSEKSVRLLGRRFVHIANADRPGYTRGPVKIGAFSFIGAGAVILPGVTIGKGCLIGAGALVNRDVPDYSIVLGNPGELRGSTIDLDVRAFRSEDYSATYYDTEALEQVRSRIVGREARDT